MQQCLLTILIPIVQLMLYLHKYCMVSKKELLFLLTTQLTSDNLCEQGSPRNCHCRSLCTQRGKKISSTYLCSIHKERRKRLRGENLARLVADWKGGKVLGICQWFTVPTAMSWAIQSSCKSSCLDSKFQSFLYLMWALRGGIRGWNFKELLHNKLRFTWGWAEVLAVYHIVRISNWAARPEIFSKSL